MVVPRRDLDIDAAAPPVGAPVLDLGVGVEHAAPSVEGGAELDTAIYRMTRAGGGPEPACTTTGTRPDESAAT